MRANIIFRYIGVVILLNAGLMLLSAIVSLLNSTDTAFYPLLLSGILTGALGSFPLLFVKKSDTLNMKESYAIVVGSWLIACVTGCFPYIIWGGEFTFASAWFESVSGFTTTGATSIRQVELLPKGLLFWRSCTHWLGGVGVVMFALVVIPMIGRTKMSLSSVELSPLARDNYSYRSNKIVRILLSLYIGMTFTQAILLKVAGMGWFDAVNHSFSTVATGGFSTHSASIGYFNSVWIEVITMFFMTLSGIHYGLIFATLTGKRNNLFRSEVTRFYLGTIFFAGLFISLSLLKAGLYPSAGETIRSSYFQVISYITTTGYVTSATNLWPPFSIMVLLWVMFQCACAGSTSGGIKSDRIWLAVKVIKAKILQQQHPSAIIRIKLNGVTQDEKLVGFAMLFIVMYVFLVFIGTLVVSATGSSLITSFSLIVTSMGNVGPGFGPIGAGGDFSALTPFVKIWSTLFMLLGRLEIFGLIQLFLLKWWR